MPVTTSARELMRRYLEGSPTDRSPVVPRSTPSENIHSILRLLRA